MLSVVMPIYDGAETLAATLHSLLDQGSANFEVLAIDQASGDGSRKILQDFANRIPITIIDAPHSKNWMTNTNIGLKAASAPFVTMLHQDDIWLPGRVDALLGLAQRHPDAELWLHPAWFMDDQGQLVGTFGPPFGRREELISSHEALRTLIVQNSIAIPSAMFRRETALRLGGLSQDLWYTADWDFWLKLATIGSVAWLPQKLAAFRIHEGSQTVRGSRDMQDFASQLRIPLQRHICELSDSDAVRTRKLAEASNELNLYLAASYHKQTMSIRPFLGKFVRLGPSGWLAFFKSTRIIPRVWPRLRILKRNKGNMV